MLIERAASRFYSHDGISEFQMGSLGWKAPEGDSVRCKQNSRPPTLVLNTRYAEKTGGNVCVSSSSESRLSSDEASVEVQVSILFSAFLSGTLKSLETSEVNGPQHRFAVT